MKRITSFLVLGLVAVNAAIGAAAVAKTADQRFGHWILRCIDSDGGAEACALHQRLHGDMTKAPVAAFAIADDEAGTDHRLTAILPLGLDIPAGVSGKIAGHDFSYKIQTCLSGGCLASTSLSAEDLSALKSQKVFTTTFRLRGVPEAVTVTVSLEGMAEGLKALDAR